MIAKQYNSSMCVVIVYPTCLPGYVYKVPRIKTILPILAYYRAVLAPKENFGCLGYSAGGVVLVIGVYC